MSKTTRNTVLAFVWAAVALLALYALPAAFDASSVVCDSDSYQQYLLVGESGSSPEDFGKDQFLDDPYANAGTAAFWGSRRPSTQMSLRPQRGGPLFRLAGRDGNLFKGAGQNPVKKISAFYRRRAGFPSPLSYRVPKDYYVFTLGRILC